MMEEAVEDGGCECGVVVEDFGPVFVGAIGGDDQSALFVSLADDLEQQVGSGFVDGQKAEFVQDQKGRPGIFFQGLHHFSGGLGGSKVVDDIDGGGEQDGMSFQTSGITQGSGQMGFANSHAAQEDHIGFVLDELEAEEILHLEAVDLFGVRPVVLIQGFDDREPRQFDAALNRAVPAKAGLTIHQLFQVIQVGPMFFGPLLGQVAVMLPHEGEL